MSIIMLKSNDVNIPTKMQRLEYTYIMHATNKQTNKTPDFKYKELTH